MTKINMMTHLLRLQATSRGQAELKTIYWQTLLSPVWQIYSLIMNTFLTFWKPQHQNHDTHQSCNYGNIISL